MRCSRSSSLLRTALLLAGLFAAGCSTTRAWDRATLARPEMAPDGDGDRDRLREHMQGTREGAAGGQGSGGGGCGCN
jgi:hypothetical protein